MSVTETDKIDAFAIEKETKRVFLSIIDPLLWDDENVHLFALQEKVNTYLYFIESGELGRAMPDSEGLDITIELILKHMPDSPALTFLDKTIQILLDKNIVFVFGPDKKTGYMEYQK